MASRTYSSGDRTALIALSGGSCMWPDCNEPLVKQVEGDFIVAAQIAHICGLEPGSARHDESMADSERNAFSNLIFLCFPHHRTVDRYPDRYSVDLLREWKASREALGLGSLSGLSGLTEGRLEEMIQAAHQEQGEVVEATLQRLERQGDDAANVIRDLLTEISQLRAGRFFPDEDTVMLLTRASDRLSHLQDTAVSINRAANKLSHLQDSAILVNNAVNRLTGLGDLSASLQDTGRLLASLNLADTAIQLRDAAERMRRVQGQM